MIMPKLHIKWERWKYNKTFEVYVSTMGNVRNKSKAPLAPKLDTDGYMRIHVGGSKPKYMYLHRLVMLTWRPTPEAETLTVDHLNHNKRDNSIYNLEWVTAAENGARAVRDQIHCGRMLSKKDRKDRKYPDAVTLTHMSSGEHITFTSDDMIDPAHVDKMLSQLCVNKSYILPKDFASKTLKDFFKFKNGTTLMRKYGYEFKSVYYA